MNNKINILAKTLTLRVCVSFILCNRPQRRVLVVEAPEFGITHTCNCSMMSSSQMAEKH